HGQLQYTIADHRCKPGPSLGEMGMKGTIDSQINVEIAASDANPVAKSLSYMVEASLDYSGGHNYTDNQVTRLRVQGKKSFKTVLSNGMLFNETQSNVLEKDLLDCPDLTSQLDFAGRALALSFGSDAREYITLVMHGDCKTATVYYRQL